MRKIRGYAAALAAVLALASTAASANDDRVYYLNQNQTGLTLPGVTMPNGSDEIRASDGTSCKSGLSGNGAYMDAGLVGSQDEGSGSIDRGAVYGRVVIPLGRVAKRVDCTQLYQLELERLKLELEAAKMGIARGSGPVGDSNVGWTTDGMVAK